MWLGVANEVVSRGIVVLRITSDTSTNKGDLVRLSDRVPKTRCVEVDATDTVTVLPERRNNGTVCVEAHRVEAKLVLEESSSSIEVFLGSVAVCLDEGELEVLECRHDGP